MWCFTAIRVVNYYAYIRNISGQCCGTTVKDRITTETKLLWKSWKYQNHVSANTTFCSMCIHATFPQLIVLTVDRTLISKNIKLWSDEPDRITKRIVFIILFSNLPKLMLQMLVPPFLLEHKIPLVVLMILNIYFRATFHNSKIALNMVVQKQKHPHYW